MLEKAKRPKQLNNQDRQTPATIQDLINRYDLDNKDIYKFLDYLIDSINENKSEVVDNLANIEEQARALNEKIVGTVLYEDETGTVENITLNDNKEKYNEIEIQGYLQTSNSQIAFTSGKMSTSLKGFSISMNRCVGENQVQFCQELITIEGTSCVRTYGNFITYIDSTLANYGQLKFYITKIIGYKY